MDVKELKFGEIYNADCMEVMRRMPEKSIDHIICDIPYDRCSKYEDSVIKQVKNNKLSKKAPYMKTAKFINSSADICDFSIEDFALQVGRIAKKSIFIFADIKQISEIRDVLENIYEYKGFRLIVWEKPNALPHNYKINYIQNIEYAIYMWRDHSSFNCEETCKYCIYRAPIFSNQYEKIHPTEKPRYLLNKIIQDITRLNDTILDPTCGSASTIVQGELMGRNCIGIEKNNKYFRKAKERIKEKSCNVLWYDKERPDPIILSD